MKSILYYLEPRTESNDKLFRYATLRSYLLPEIDGLRIADKSLDFKMIVSRTIYNKAKQNNLKMEGIDFIIIDEDVFEKNSYLKNINVSNELYHGNLNIKANEELKSIISACLPVDYKPDIIISYESPAPFFKEIFPSSLLLNAMFGIFSRAPFPAYGLLDPCGLY